MLTIVVLGASAGGLEPLRAFMRAATPDPSIAFVVVTHLPARHESHLVSLLDKVGTLPVRPALHEQCVEGGSAYVLPPGVLMGIHDGHFELEAASEKRQFVKPIDFFMMALAEDAPERCVGVVLSGTDHDGTAGLKAIKAAGGLALVQSPETAEFTGMPCSAIESGVADQVLAPDAMPEAIREYMHHAPLDMESLPIAEEASRPDASMEEVLQTIYARTGHDFRWYRPPMLRRRLRRRMGLNKLDRVGDYLRLLTESQAEIEALKNEFLIGVTDFFRDPEVWRELETAVVPQLVTERANGRDPIRVWTPGCATGEETYSVAMLLLEQFPEHFDIPPIQVFGTDIDLDALAIARTGSYPAASLSNVSPERLARFFDHHGDRYVARRPLRDSIVFAPHNLARDTPYSKLDLVLCRNVLIYFRPELQQRVVEVFHFALKPGGLLLLGKAESIGAPSDLFELASATTRLFRRVGGRSHLPLGFGRGAGSAYPLPKGVQHGGADRAPSPEEILQRGLAGRAVTAAVLLDREGRALHFHGETELFLQHQGAASLELLSLVRPGLRARLRRAVREAVTEHRPAELSLMLETATGPRQVSVKVEPVAQDHNLQDVLVLFNLAAPGAVGAGAAGRTQEVERDYEEARQELAIALQEAERSNEELRIANEESLSLNEELQSSNEELESSKEELQSLNEELATVNAQLEEKILELARSNDDLANVLASSRVATVVLDRERRVRRFTPSANEIFSLQPGDEGRLLSDISSRLADPDFARDVSRVELSEEVIDAELTREDGTTYLRRVLPYRRADGTVDGVVATFLDVTPLRNASRRMGEFVAVLKDSNDAVIVFDLEGTVLEWNQGATRAYGYERDAIVGSSIFALVPAEAREELRNQIASARDGRRVGPIDARRLCRDGSVLTVSVTVSVLRDARSSVYALLSTERDITQRLQSEREMYFRRLADLIPALLRVEDVHGRTQFANQACADFTGRARTTLLGEGWLDLMSPEDRPAYLSGFAEALAKRTKYSADYRWRRDDGSYRWVRSVTVPHFHESGELAGYVSLGIDVEDRKRAEEALLTADRRKDEYLAMLAHELRNPLAPIRNGVALITRIDAANPQTSWAAGVISRQVEVLAKLLDDLLDVARFASGKITLNITPLDLAVIVDRAIEISRPLVESRRQRIVTQLGPDPLVVEGDLMRLTQVLTNLLNNASKYSDPGSEIRIDVARHGAEVSICVSDDGVGISAEMLPRVFDMFAQADRTLDRAKGGLGLGLTLVRRLVELHHGSVEARSAGPGQGSQFIVRLPVVPVAAPGPSNPSEPAESRPDRARRVLIVDDNTDSCESLAMLLRLRSHEVQTAHDAEEALAISARWPPDVAILDIGLPGIDGYQLARAMRGRSVTANATLIALTGYSQPDDLMRSAASGFDQHLVKPVDPDRLIAVVEADAHEAHASPTTP